MYIDNIYTKEVNDIEELIKELARQKVGQESRSNWYAPSWSDEYVILMQGKLGEVICISSEEEKEIIEEAKDDIFIEKPSFFIVK